MTTSMKYEQGLLGRAWASPTLHWACICICTGIWIHASINYWQITLIVPYIKTRFIYTCIVATWPTCTCCSREELQHSNILFYEFLPVRHIYSCIKRNGAMQVHILLYLHKPKTIYCNVDLYSFEITRIHLRPPAFVHCTCIHLCTVEWQRYLLYL